MHKEGMRFPIHQSWLEEIVLPFALAVLSYENDPDL